MSRIFDMVDEELERSLDRLNEALLKEFPSLSRFSVELRPTDSGANRTTAVMISLKSGHCVRTVKTSPVNAIRHAIAKMHATMYAPPTKRQQEEA